MFSGANILYADDIMRINIPLSEFIPTKTARDAKICYPWRCTAFKKVVSGILQDLRKEISKLSTCLRKTLLGIFLAVRHLEKNSAIHMFPMEVFPTSAYFLKD